MKNLIIIFMMVPLSVLSQYTSKLTGDWSTGTSWDGGISPPLTSGKKLNDDVQVVQSTTITHNGNLEVQAGSTLRVDGELIITGNITFKNGSIVIVSSTGKLNILSSGGNANNSTNITIDGQLFINDDFTAGNGSTIVGNGGVTIGGTSSGSGTIFGSNTGCSDCSFGTTLSINLMSFKSEVCNNLIYLKWVVTSQVNNNYYTIYKSYDNYNWVDVAHIDGQGTTNRIMEYKWFDENIFYGTLYYKLRQTDYDGNYEEFQSISCTAIDPNINREIIYKINLLGTEVNNQFRGFCIKMYHDGGYEKTYIK